MGYSTIACRTILKNKPKRSLINAELVNIYLGKIKTMHDMKQISIQETFMSTLIPIKWHIWLPWKWGKENRSKPWSGYDKVFCFRNSCTLDDFWVEILFIFERIYIVCLIGYYVLISSGEELPLYHVTFLIISMQIWRNSVFRLICQYDSARYYKTFHTNCCMTL